MAQCTLCDLPAETGVENEDGEPFCCPGCLEVYRSLGDVEPTADHVSSAVGTGSDSETDTAEFDTEACETAYLAVDGMHCSTCELFLESVASDHEGIVDAEASYAAETVRLVYDPDEVSESALPDVLSGLGYQAHSREHETDTVGRDDISRLLVGGLFGMMAMTWYALFLYPTYFGYEPIVTLGTFDGAYLYAQLAVVTAIILLYTGRPVLRGAYVSLRARRPNVDLLVATAAVAAFTYSTGRLLVGGTDLYYDVTIVVILAVTVGNYYEGRIKRKTAGLLSELTDLQVTEATRRDGATVPVADIEAGDQLLVEPGERIPVDGTVAEGTAAVDESLLTGESMPETKTEGDTVSGGTVVTDAPLVVEAADGAESTLDRIVELMWEIQATRPGAQRVADKLATVFVPLVLLIAVLVTGGLFAAGSPPQAAVLTGLTVVIVSCPCALGLATPLAVASGLQSAAERGVVVATPALFEHAADVDTVVFDKTGTLTTGEMTVTDIWTADTTEQTLLARAAAVEQFSEHPIADAVAEAAPQVTASDTDQAMATFERDTWGVSAVVDGERVLVGDRALFETRDWAIPASVASRADEVESEGEAAVLVGWDGGASGVLAVGETPRQEWDAVASELGGDRQIVVLTGDDGPSADRLREHPAVDDVFAGVPPDGKAETVRRLARSGTVAMVGDGSNDAPALATADVGIALETGTKLATDAADAVVLGGDLRRVPETFAVAAGTKRRIRENLGWAFLYNCVAVPMAVTSLLNPLLAAVAMATSSFAVVLNSARTPSGLSPLPEEAGVTPDQSDDPGVSPAGSLSVSPSD